jgi:broad specificity phosphatase PhoE
MPRIYLVRHGKAEAGFGENMDPGLDALGHAQATAVGERLKDHGPLAILSSPLRRAQETAAPLAKHWSKVPVIFAPVAEIPSPRGMGLEERVVWLRKVMGGSWREVTPELARWREDCIASVAALKNDSVIFSHYVAINVLYGGATGGDAVTLFSPDNCSVTIFETDGSKLRLIEKGGEAPLTKVN